ncbi:ABC transporter ATP-binding protein [Rhizohabitans arisaemae]|uniref:ABC transporter ATP-binding protein n=1 Tax=Rhizohabitans arisaemae TaxID=2720610 RepID=UPI0024B1F56F|nr:ABC transporter ATP-binding protein [Rhizohabitans arisaemae]
MNDSNSPAIEISGLRKRFGQVVALDGTDLRIGVGEVVAVLGPNGAGKTTMLDILLGLQRPDAGEVRVLGGPVRKAIDEGRIGVVLQEGEPLQGVSVREMIRMLADIHPHPMPLDAVLAHAQLTDLVDRRTEKLSGGETQRLRFGMALVGDPELLVLDEPTAAMDIAARRSFWTMVRGLAAGGRTILFSTHYLEEADAIADRIVLMAHGRVVADGPTTEIRAMASGRVIRCTLPDAVPGDDLAADLRALPAVTDVEVHGTAVTIRSADADATVRALFAAYWQARDLEVVAAPLSDAVFSLTEDRPADGAQLTTGATR